MKVCFLEIQPFPYNIGGGTTYLLKISKYLIKMGHDVSIITSRAGDNQKRLPTPKGLKIYNVGLPHKIFRKSGLMKTIVGLAYRAIWEISWIFSAKRKLAEINPDVCNPQSAITTSLPCSISNRPFVVNQHGVHLEGFRELWKERKTPIVVRLADIYSFIEGYNCKKARKIFCVNQATYDFYSKFGKSKCVLLPHAVDFDNFKTVNFSKKKDYLFVGRLTEQKGASYLIDALELLDRKGKSLTLNIIGDGEPSYVNPLKEKAANFKNIKVNFLGFVTGKRFYESYLNSSVLISSSIFESFGLVILEAMAGGCAIISADHDGGRLLVKKPFGIIFPFQDKKSRTINLAKAIEKSLKWDTYKMGMAARKEAAKHSYEKLAEIYANYYKQVISEATFR